MALSNKQKAFVAEYLLCWNASEAARRSGYSARTARQQGARLLTNANIQTAIQARLATLDAIFEATARAYLEHANRPEIIAETKGPQAVAAAALAIDKMRLLRELPTEIVSLLPGVLRALDTLHLNPSEVFLAMIREAAAQHDDGEDDGPVTRE